MRTNALQAYQPGVRQLAPTCPTINQQFLFRPPNVFDRLLYQEGQVWETIQDVGGIFPVISPLRRRLIGNLGPGLDGDVGERREIPTPGYVGSILMPAFDGLDHLVLAFTIPVGYDGILKGFTQLYTGLGFVEGSGDISWRVQVNRRYLKGMGNMQTSMGSLQGDGRNMPVGVMVQSRQWITYWVNLLPAAAARLDATARIVCTVSGWLYPQQG
jgi:hypothetical protein